MTTVCSVNSWKQDMTDADEQCIRCYKDITLFQLYNSGTGIVNYKPV